jgi:cytochrome c oxidase cbb3-type subunit III
MTEFTSSFWDVYIALITIVSIVACAVFLKSQGVRRAPGKVDTAGVKATTGHTWDEDLAEYNNPLPRWWSWLFYITIAFGLAYLVLYPGLGSWKGVLGWSEVGQYREETELAAKQYGPIYDKFAGMEIADLSVNPEALAIGQKLFLNNCAQCHASDGGGSRGFPNLTDRDWLYGGDPKTIEASIANGRNGTMPPFGEALKAEDIKDVAHYVMSLSGGAADSIRVARGRDTFMNICAACHGPEGKGNPALGAPNLTDKIWLHGGGEARIVETITRGRASQMPAHKASLGEAKVKLLAAYVLSLSK